MSSKQKPGLSEIQHIAAIQQRWLAADRRIAATTANALSDIINSVFGDPARIGYELLQNADDAARQEGLHIEVEFYLLDRHLLVQHNGKPFSPQDVEALCRYGAPGKGPEAEAASEKQYDLKKTGYKGIGFKSVFNIADKVWVLSDGYTFRFDKSHWQMNAMPWQIVPVFTPREEMPGEAKPYLRDGWVHFILEIRDFEDPKTINLIKRKTALLFEKEHIILFLRHIMRVSMAFQDPRSGEIVPYRELARRNEEQIFTLEKQEKGAHPVRTRWQVSTFETPVPEAVRRALEPLDKRQCPEKLKRAEAIEISFAALLRDDNSIVPLDLPLLFSYLPTQKRYRFSFLANSNFLMNEARTELLDEAWNEFLFEQIGYYQFHWFRELAGDRRFRFEFAGLLVKYADSNPEPRNRRLNAGVERARREVAFVPVLDGGALRKAPETIIDQTELSTGLGDRQLVRESFEEQQLEIADPNIKQIDNLISVGARQFGRQQLRDAIRQSNRYRKPEENIRLVEFLFKRIKSIPNLAEQIDWEEVLSDTPFLLSQEKALREPRELYLPVENPELPFSLPMAFLHKKAFEALASENKTLREWLLHLGAALPRPAEIIRRGVFALIREGEVAAGNAIAIGRYIFRHYLQLSGSELDKLSELPVLAIRNNLLKVSSAYLADAYEPRLPLEHLLKDDIFISPAYIAEGESPGAWNRFWSRLGARQEMDVELKEAYLPWNAETKREYGDYLAFLEAHLPPFNRKARHGLQNMVLPTYIEYASGFEFALAYWRILLSEKWGEVRRKCGKCRFQHSQGNAPIPSYFEYLVRVRPFFPAQDGLCHPTTEVYSASLKPLVGNLRPVSALPMSPEQEAFLGIVAEPGLEGCLGLLEEIARASSETLDKQQITALYEYILSRRFQPEAVQAWLSGRAEFRLLSVNNSFQPIAKLAYFNLPNFALKSDAPGFAFLDLPREKALAFCRLFGLPAAEPENLRFRFRTLPVKDEEDFYPEWESRLPLIAALAAGRRGQNMEGVLAELLFKTESLGFQAASAMSLYWEQGGEEAAKKEIRAWMDGGRLYYRHPWQEPQTLYDLSELLARHLGLGGLVRELELLLSLSPAEAAEWIRNQGFDPGMAEAKGGGPARGRYLWASPEEAEAVSPAIIPAVAESEPPRFDKTSAADTEAIGRWGEQYVFSKKMITGYYQQKERPLLSIEWANEHAEQNLPYDFIAHLPGGVSEYWEVKSTVSPSKASFPISPQELRFALLNRQAYHIIRILKAGKKAPLARIIEDPVGLVEAGRIAIVGAMMELREDAGG